MRKDSHSSRAWLVLLLLLLCVLTACEIVTSEERARQAAVDKEEVVIGIVYSSSVSNFFLEGVEQAVETLNRNGGILGRHLKILVYDDHQDPKTAETIARKLASNSQVVAVLGHGHSKTALPASIIYEKAGIVFISYGAKAPDLTLHSGHYTFRNIPTHKDFGAEMAAMARRVYGEKMKKTVVFHEREDSQKSLADIFKKSLADIFLQEVLEATKKSGKQLTDIEPDKITTGIVATRSYFGDQTDFKEIIDQLDREYQFDVVVISGQLQGAAILVKQLREMGFTGPIIGGDGLDSPDLFAIAGDAADGIIVPTVFHASYPDRLTRSFVKAFQAEHELTPDNWAAQGYDAIRIFAHAVEQAGSSIPEQVASSLRFLKHWKGVTGGYSMTSRGDIVNKEIFFKKLVADQFVILKSDNKYPADLFNYIEDRSLRLPIATDITTLDPGFSQNQADLEVAEQLFLALTGLSGNLLQAVPELALSWSGDDDQFVFKMRRDVNWSDGTPVTANDLVWAIRRNFQAGNVVDLLILENAEAIHQGTVTDITTLGVKAEDDYTLQFDLAYSAPYFPALVSLPVYRPLPRHLIEKQGQAWTNPEHLVVNGPYTLAQRQASKGVFLAKNSTYFQAQQVAIPEVRYFVTPQEALGLAMYENGELDVIGGRYLPLPTAEIHRLRKSALGREYRGEAALCTYVYLVNTERKPFNEVLVRKALAAAIDRQLLLDIVNAGVGEPAASVTPPMLLGGEATKVVTGIGFDPLAAANWLAEAGYGNGKNFPGLRLGVRESLFNEEIAETVASFFENYLKIEVTLQGEDDDERGTEDLVIEKICSTYPDIDSSMKGLYWSALRNERHWADEHLVDLIDEIRVTTDLATRHRYYQEAENLLCQEEVVVIPLYHEVTPLLLKPYLRGWRHAALGGQQVDQWFFELQ